VPSIIAITERYTDLLLNRQVPIYNSSNYGNLITTLLLLKLIRATTMLTWKLKHFALGASKGGCATGGWRLQQQSATNKGVSLLCERLGKDVREVNST